MEALACLTAPNAADEPFCEVRRGERVRTSWPSRRPPVRTRAHDRGSADWSGSPYSSSPCRRRARRVASHRGQWSGGPPTRNRIPRAASRPLTRFPSQLAQVDVANSRLATGPAGTTENPPSLVSLEACAREGEERRAASRNQLMERFEDLPPRGFRVREDLRVSGESPEACPSGPASRRPSRHGPWNIRDFRRLVVADAN